MLHWIDLGVLTNSKTFCWFNFLCMRQAIQDLGPLSSSTRGFGSANKILQRLQDCLQVPASWAFHDIYIQCLRFQSVCTTGTCTSLPYSNYFPLIQVGVPGNEEREKENNFVKKKRATER